MLNKCALSLDLETFINASFGNSLNLPNPWTNSFRKINPLFGMMPLKRLSRNALLKNPSLWCQIKHDPSRSNVMYRNMHLVQSLCNSMSMVIDTHVPSYHEPSPRWNRIMKFMIASFYPWSKPFKNGNTIFKDLHTKQQSIRTTRTSHISEALRNSINNKPDGHSFYPNTTSNWFIFLDLRWSSLTHYHDDLILSLKRTLTTKALSCYQINYSLTWLTSNFNRKLPILTIWIWMLPLPSCSF